MRHTHFALCFAALALGTLPAIAQEVSSPVVYRTEFVLRDDGEATKSPRRYNLVLNSNGRGSLREGLRIPIRTGNPVAAAVNHYDSIVQIECRLEQVGERVRLEADLQITTVSQPDKLEDGSLAHPVTGNTRLAFNAFLRPGKPVVVGAINDPVTARKLDIEASLTKID